MRGQRLWGNESVERYCRTGICVRSRMSAHLKRLSKLDAAGGIAHFDGFVGGFKVRFMHNGSTVYKF